MGLARKESDRSMLSAVRTTGHGQKLKFSMCLPMHDRSLHDILASREAKLLYEKGDGEMWVEYMRVSTGSKERV